jgi:hypothetical protein
LGHRSGTEERSSILKRRPLILVLEDFEEAGFVRELAVGHEASEILGVDIVQSLEVSVPDRVAALLLQFHQRLLLLLTGSRRPFRGLDISGQQQQNGGKGNEDLNDSLPGHVSAPFTARREW